MNIAFTMAGKKYGIEISTRFLRVTPLLPSWFNHWQVIWAKFTGSDKIRLSVESVIADFFRLSSAIIETFN